METREGLGAVHRRQPPLPAFLGSRPSTGTGGRTGIASAGGGSVDGPFPAGLHRHRGDNGGGDVVGRRGGGGNTMNYSDKILLLKPIRFLCLKSTDLKKYLYT